MVCLGGRLESEEREHERTRGAEQTNAAFRCEVIGFGNGAVVFTFRYVTSHHWATGVRLVPDVAEGPVAFIFTGLNVGQFDP